MSKSHTGFIGIFMFFGIIYPIICFLKRRKYTKFLKQLYPPTSLIQGIFVDAKTHKPVQIKRYEIKRIQHKKHGSGTEIFGRITIPEQFNFLTKHGVFFVDPTKLQFESQQDIHFSHLDMATIKEIASINYESEFINSKLQQMLQYENRCDTAFLYLDATQVPENKTLTLALEGSSSNLAKNSLLGLSTEIVPNAFDGSIDDTIGKIQRKARWIAIHSFLSIAFVLVFIWWISRITH